MLWCAVLVWEGWGGWGRGYFDRDRRVALSPRVLLIVIRERGVEGGIVAVRARV